MGFNEWYSHIQKRLNKNPTEEPIKSGNARRNAKMIREEYIMDDDRDSETIPPLSIKTNKGNDYMGAPIMKVEDYIVDIDNDDDSDIKSITSKQFSKNIVKDESIGFNKRR